MLTSSLWHESCVCTATPTPRSTVMAAVVKIVHEKQLELIKLVQSMSGMSLGKLILTEEHQPYGCTGGKCHISTKIC